MTGLNAESSLLRVFKVVDARPVVIFMFVLLSFFLAVGATQAFCAPPEPHEVASKMAPSVLLLVSANIKQEPIAVGTGFVVGKGLVATNAHVIKEATYVVAKRINSEEYFLADDILAFSKERDLAVLSFPDLNAPALNLGSADLPKIGEVVYAMGNPKGLEGTFSVGNVSAIRDIKGIQMVQITAPISPGSSGGPVVDAYGRSIGISTAQLAQGQNLNFAVPINYLVSLMKKVGLSPGGSVAPQNPAAQSPKTETAAKKQGAEPAGKTERTAGGQAKSPEAALATKVDISKLFSANAKDSDERAKRIEPKTLQSWFVDHPASTKR